VVGEDGQEPQVVGVEAVEAQLREGDHADRGLVITHRHDEHRFIDVVGARDRRAPGVAVGIVDEERLAVDCHPTGEPLTEPTTQQVEVDLVVGADTPLERDRHDEVGRLEQVDPRVVVVDDPARLLDDRSSDGLDRRRPAQATRCRLQHLELRGSRLGLLEQLGVRQRDAGVRGQRRDESDVAVGPVARLARDGR
jgi:hypothetical protein